METYTDKAVLYSSSYCERIVATDFWIVYSLDAYESYSAVHRLFASEFVCIHFLVYFRLLGLMNPEQKVRRLTGTGS
jgi:hypothetical protein